MQDKATRGSSYFLMLMNIILLTTALIFWRNVQKTHQFTNIYGINAFFGVYTYSRYTVLRKNLNISV